MNGDYRIARRKRLFQKSPFCNWCGKRLQLAEQFIKGGKMHPYFPTIDHLNHRTKENHRPHIFEEATVLSCFPCNQLSAVIEQKVNLIGEKWSNPTYQNKP